MRCHVAGDLVAARADADQNIGLEGTDQRGQLRPPKPRHFTPEAAELAAIAAQVQALGRPPRILIIDDAVDSGATLAATIDHIQAIAGPDAVLRTAAITVTTAAPSIEPNFMLYRYVLCRFPWSLDFKN